MSDSDWTKWSAIAEMLSSVAIVVTLVFLAIQTGQNTDAINAQLDANRAEARAAIWALIYKPIEFTVNYPKVSIALRSTEPLTPETEARLDDFFVAFWGAREFAWAQYRDGVVDQRTFETMMDERHFFEYSRVETWWERNAVRYFDREFVRLIDEQYRP